MNDNELVTISVKNANDGSTLAEVRVRKGPITMFYEDNSTEKMCRAGLVSDCLNNMFDGCVNNNEKLLKQNANDFMLALISSANGENTDLEFHLECSKFEGCPHEKDNLPC